VCAGDEVCRRWRANRGNMKSVAGIVVVRIGVMILAAIFEVAGDALIRAGLRGKGFLLVLAGFGVLGSYGVIVNLLPMDFSKLLGGYVGFFAIVSVVGGRLIFKESPPLSTWAGLAVILLGSVIIQAGAMRSETVRNPGEGVSKTPANPVMDATDRRK
jgi:drug/metabolite transporter superfamily protein YnfA